jgi:uncharacterized membrane protein YfcA
MTFPVSGVEISPLVPLLTGLIVSAVSSMGGVSGAFLLVPFQISALGFASPAVSPTTLIFNTVAIPSGVYRYVREGRMVWPLTCVIVAGTLPGMALGVILRMECLPNPTAFRFFVGCVLLYVGGRLLYDAKSSWGKAPDGRRAFSRDSGMMKREQTVGVDTALEVRTLAASWRELTYAFSGETFSVRPVTVLPFVFAVGVVSGAYGVGGGSIIGPLLVTFFRLPVHTIAGATLMSTFITSIAGVAFYGVAAIHYADTDLAVAPDWLLGLLFGLGGAIGMYVGARCQKYFPARLLKLLLACVLLFVALRYVGRVLL